MIQLGANRLSQQFLIIVTLFSSRNNIEHVGKQCTRPWTHEIVTSSMQTLHLQFCPKCIHRSLSILSWERSHPTCTMVKNDNGRESQRLSRIFKINAYMYISSISISQPFQSLHVLIVQLNLGCLEILSNSWWSDWFGDNCIASVKAEGNADLKVS